MFAKEYKKTRVGRSDIIEFLNSHGNEKLDRMAGFIGYECTTEQVSINEKSEEDGDSATKLSPPPLPPPPPPPPPPTKKTIKFWHVSEYREKKQDEINSEVPEWVEGDSFEDEEDGEVSSAYWKKPPCTPPLVPWSQLWPFLRNRLGDNKESKSIDIERVIELVSKLRPISKLPKKQRFYWSAVSYIILDFDKRLFPFWIDINEIHYGIKKLRGRSGLEVFSIDNGPSGQFRKRNVFPEPKVDFKFPEPNTPLMIMSDLGCFQPSGKSTRSWLYFGQRLKKAGLCPVVLTPCPPRLWNKALLEYFNLFFWDRGHKLPRHKEGVYKYNTLSKLDESQDAEVDNKQLEEEKKQTKRLLSLLSPAIRVEPSLLRAVRFLLPRKEADAGVEVAVWNHEDINYSPIAFSLKKDSLKNYRKALLEEDSSLREKVISLIEKHHSHLPESIRCEESLIINALLGDSINTEYDLKRAEAFMQKYMRTLKRKDFLEKKEVRAWFYRFSDRQPEEVWKKYKVLTACWVKINSHDREDGEIEVKKGMSLDDAAWMMDPNKSSHTILQRGNEFTLKNGYGASETDNAFKVSTPIAYLTTNRPYLDMFYYKSGEEVYHRGLNLSLSKVDKIVRPFTGEIIFNTDHEEIVITSTETPSWAESMGQSGQGLFVTFKDRKEPVWWFNPGRYKTQSSAKNKSIIINRGFWGDSTGEDEYGLYVDFKIKGINQRMRWIEPGKFMMGSPEDEPERLDREKLHEVTLTEGFWLAETACTQELWEAVMGENPSQFKGNQKPVDNVSWNDCNLFVEKINQIADLNFRMPTEAQWEYACRAGTQTPFSFGEEITKEEVNYVNNAGIVDVRSLPCNNWGLYEMHGNVWEWCQDWYDANYDIENVVNPTGPMAGSKRVLRGGGWYDLARSVRSAYRSNARPDNRDDFIGFRLSRGHKK